MESRAPRITEDRSYEERKAQFRKTLQMVYKHPLDIDPELIPKNMEYKWVTGSIHGWQDNNRLVTERRKGWVPVPPQNHPELISEFDADRPHMFDGYIHYKGAILCQRPKEFGDMERELEAEANFMAMQSIPGLNGLKDIPSKTYKNSTSIQTMESFKED